MDIQSNISRLQELAEMCREARAALEFAAAGYSSRLDIPLVGESDMAAPADAQAALQAAYNAKVANIKTIAGNLGVFE